MVPTHAVDVELSLLLGFDLDFRASEIKAHEIYYLLVECWDQQLKPSIELTFDCGWFTTICGGNSESVLGESRSRAHVYNLQSLYSLAVMKHFTLMPLLLKTCSQTWTVSSVQRSWAWISVRNGTAMMKLEHSHWPAVWTSTSSLRWGKLIFSQAAIHIANFTNSTLWWPSENNMKSPEMENQKFNRSALRIFDCLHRMQHTFVYLLLNKEAAIN